MPGVPDELSSPLLVTAERGRTMRVSRTMTRFAADARFGRAYLARRAERNGSGGVALETCLYTQVRIQDLVQRSHGVLEGVRGNGFLPGRVREGL